MPELNIRTAALDPAIDALEKLVANRRRRP